jgi:hypothetical protein
METAATCATNQGWSIEVEGSNNAKYTVRWCYQGNMNVQYDYECTCPGFQHRRKPCKHIKWVEASRARCGWNAELEPTRKVKDDKCPGCGGEVVYLRVAV